MRRILFTLLLCAFAAVAVAQDQPAAEKPWFDMEKCAFCKELAAQPGLVDHMRHEYHNTATGILSVTYVDAEYKDKFNAAQKGMQKVAEGMASATEMPPMCQHCAKYGEFYIRGVKIEPIASEMCWITSYSHSDPAVIAELQAFGKRNAEELAKYKKSAE